MVWLPTASADVVNVATPEPFNVPVPMELPPSRKLTVPLGVPAPGDAAETVAVNVTDWPKTEGLTDDVTAVVVLSLFTTCDSTADVLPVNVPSPG